MNTLKLNNSSIEIASEWNELKLKPLLKLIQLFYKDKLKLTPAQWKYAALYIILDVKWYNILFLWKFIHLDKIDVVSLFPLIQWVQKDNKLTIFKLKHISRFFTKYYPPKDGLLNITIDEFRHLDPMYVKYKKTKDVDYLDGLVAVLYRKKRDYYNPNAIDFGGDIRENFNKHYIIKNSKKIAKIALAKKLTILWAYEGSRNEIIESCPHLFSSSEEKKQGRDFGYGGLILELSGDKFGDFENTSKTNLITAFNFLEMEAIKIEKIRRK